MEKRKKRFAFLVAILLATLVLLLISTVSFAENPNHNMVPLTYSHVENGQDASESDENRIKPFPVSRAVYEQVRAAEEVYWCGGRKALLKEGADFCLIDLQTGESSPLFLVLPENDGEFNFFVRNGWIIASNETTFCFFRLGTNEERVIQLDPNNTLFSYETWTDPATGRSVLLLVVDGVSEVYEESGKLLNRLEWKELVENANYDHITNGRLLGYRKQDGCAVIRDVITGQDLKVFAPGWVWHYYEGNHEIFEDGTAVLDDWALGEHMIVDLDGQELIRTTMFIDDRDAGNFYRLSPEDGHYYLWNQNTCELFDVSETKVDEEMIVTGKTRINPGEEIPGTVYIPEIADGSAAGKYAFIMPEFKIVNSYDENQDKPYYYIQSENGVLLGGQIWSDMWHTIAFPGIGYTEEQYFVRNGFLPVKSMDGKWGVLAPDGHMILPAEFDKIIGADTGFDADKEYIASSCDGFIAWKDGEIGIYDLNGRPVFAWRNYLQDSIMK